MRCKFEEVHEQGYYEGIKMPDLIECHNGNTEQANCYMCEYFEEMEDWDE